MRVAAQMPASGLDEDPALQEEIQRLYREAKEAGDRDDWNTAYRLMLEAWDKRRAADVAVNLAFIEMQLRKWREAATHLTFGLGHFPADADPQLMRLNTERLAQVKQEIVTITLAVEPSGAQVFLGGERLGVGSELPSEVFAAPGTIEISAELDGYERAVTRFSAQKGETRSVRLVLATPTSGRTVPPQGRDVHPVEKRFEWWPAVIGGGLTLAAVGVGVVFKLDADAAGDDADALNSRVRAEFGDGVCATKGSSADSLCSDLRDSRDQQASSNQLSNIALISAVGLGAATVAVQAVFLMSKPTARQGTLELTPIIGVDATGLIATKRF